MRSEKHPWSAEGTFHAFSELRRHTNRSSVDPTMRNALGLVHSVVTVLSLLAC